MIKNLVVAGGGTLGSQIAFQSAYFGKNVTIYDISDQALEAAKGRIEKLETEYKNYFNVDQSVVDKVADGITYSSDLKEATADADLVIEAVPESDKIKESYYKQLMEVIPDNTLIGTNTSTMLPSHIAQYVGEKDLYRFSATHYANHVWASNTFEIMPVQETATETTDALVQFANETGLTPVVLKKEQAGYILNSLLIPWFYGGLRLWADDIADPAEVDKVWMIDLRVKRGPFAEMDVVGTRTVLDITKRDFGDSDDKTMLKAIDKLQEMVDNKEYGRETNKGFYTYPNPSFMDVKIAEMDK
ncbi:3-hydroxybutyryl-CoA dehydrogenase [Weissella uvarum]|uniref:3-hydroxyacyl-CoA dehydrogenase n=1 Tax=Weissella uvarum TaxID=1479233 RepID=UPI00195F6870|nr:3-hydroxyacyl-CoA dehydrogenase [Weissella uvarum]MBM7617593.1 3-hydroxybutyryl-CoA dehydrogenase [Weissella uvarum]MCM0595945.1 3-hydroxyacyl-CoA dehydrogenase [Weissella uvarum]